MIKRLFDIIIASSLFLFLSLLFLIIIICIKIMIGGPVLFTQIRPGLYNKAFYIYKFRSMTDERDELGNLLPDEQRITKLGRFLRKYSLDELPQLLNVLKGELSLVGPRPLLMEYIDLYDEEQARRQHVKPGITGWAQINGRNGISWEDKFKLDVWYVDHQSFWLDLKIIALTMLKVLKKEGVSSDGYISTPYFRGTKQNRPSFIRFNDIRKDNLNTVLRTYIYSEINQSSIKEILQEAKAKQIYNIAFAQPNDTRPDRFFSFVEQVRSITKAYNHIHIYVGYQIISRNTEEISVSKEIIEKSDFVIGVVDLLDDKNGQDNQLFEMDPTNLVTQEFELAMRLIQHAPIDILSPRGFFSKISNQSFPSQYMRRILEATLERKIAMDIHFPYILDDPRVLQLYREINPYISFGSEVHQ